MIGIYIKKHLHQITRFVSIFKRLVHVEKILQTKTFAKLIVAEFVEKNMKKFE